MSSPESDWLMLTPPGALHAFSQHTPTATQAALRSLLDADTAPMESHWLQRTAYPPEALEDAIARGWVQRLQRAMPGPDTQLDAFLHHVVASLSHDRKAALASESGFCLCRAGLTAEEAELLCAAAADYFDFARRQARRGWDISGHYLSLHQQAHLLLPTHTFVPLWVDQTGYWLVILGDPLLNNPALVELLWAIQRAGTRFGAPVA